MNFVQNSGEILPCRTDQAILDLFPENEPLARWIHMAQQRIAFQGLPARICWLGYGERARAGLKFNELVAQGELSAPIVIGRDHLDAGSVASPRRETEGMRDGSDAIADWPLLNALVNAVGGATWVSIHHGGGVGIGYSIHAGQVIVADGTPAAAIHFPMRKAVLEHRSSGTVFAVHLCADLPPVCDNRPWDIRITKMRCMSLVPRRYRH